MYQLVVYVPETHLASLKEALFAVGAGRLGDYDHCCWQTAGQGQFRPLPGSQPWLGHQGNLEQLTEYRVEVLCADKPTTERAVSALQSAHPYEEPAYSVVRLCTDFHPPLD